MFFFCYFGYDFTLNNIYNTPKNIISIVIDKFDCNEKLKKELKLTYKRHQREIPAYDIFFKNHLTYI